MLIYTDMAGYIRIKVEVESVTPEKQRTGSFHPVSTPKHLGRTPKNPYTLSLRALREKFMNYSV